MRLDPNADPQQIGPYRVLRVLGEGGMGAVYEAEEVGPVRRRVAVKVVRGAINSAQVIGRFEAERQALAMMNHPCIAKVYQAGTTAEGQPWFSMELVRGMAITAYCDHNRLTVAERVALFIDVCKGVQHAHQKSVVHRDLKPSNILVADLDDGRSPKIIDFGVAKALGHQLTDTAFVTLAGMAVGTAAYMSPEQADPTGLDVDTRSDIYSLGVLLFELLIGELPADPRVNGLHAFIAQVASGRTSPPAPSARFSGSHQSGAVAFARRTDPRHLRQALRGDLDWIVMMAMHPERTQRYATAAALADDLERFLNHQPVAARPPTTRYRVAKFVERHRAGVAAAAIVATAVSVSAVGATVGLVRARRAEAIAASEAAAAQQVTDFLVGLFNTNAPGSARRDSLTAHDILTLGAQRATSALASQPRVQSRLLLTLGGVHRQMGYYDEAQRLLDQALQIREREFGQNDTSVATALREVGELARIRGNLPRADSAIQRMLRIREAASGREQMEYLTGMQLLAALRLSAQKPAEAESLLRVVVQLDAKVRPGADSARARNIRNLGNAAYAQGRLADADSLYNVALALQEHALGKDHIDVAGTLNNLGASAQRARRYSDALAYYLRAQPIIDRTLPPTHNTSIGIRNNLGEVYWKLGKLDPAERLLREALAAKEKTLPPADPRIATTLNALAGVLRDGAKYGQAEPLYKRALAIREPAAKSNPIDVAETLRDYGDLLGKAGRRTEAVRLIARADSLRPSGK